MTRAWTTCIAALLVLGCQSGEEPARGAQRGVDPPMVYQLRPEPSHVRVDTPDPPLRELPTIEEETLEDESERDLAEELKAAIGVPVDCVRDYAAASPTTIRISINAIVRPTGMIIEPSVYGAGLSMAAVNCIKTRVGTIKLNPLDDTVSQTVSTVIEVNYEPEVIVKSDPGVPEPQLRNVKEPLPKRPEVAPSGRPIMEPTSKWISGGEKTERPIQEPTSKKIKGPKPRPIDGYEVDENAQEWR